MTEVLDDGIDRLLVHLLAEDGRATLTTLAAAAGLSVSAVQARVRRLEAKGVIRAYSADVDPEALGLPLAAFVAITPLDPAQPDDAPERLMSLPAIEACYSVAGDESYLLLVRVASPRALEELLAAIRATANVRTRTTVVLSTAFERRSVAYADRIPAVE
ncbi:Lrp/AsnC family transcriptional regulator [Kineococcus xinjiangensis]|uniref:Lrp/AsnC family transcriptional regulator n=1 Tax=Kineococcus xinjiangensis TaxID=512762 RepID=UPI001B80A832|nr:Lrp/AsnC family transcriptional regulator [Kineococcus xinjiangensis]